MTEVPPGNVLHRFASPRQVIIVSGEAQDQVEVSVGSVSALGEHERCVLCTTGNPAWYPPEPVRDELTRLRDRLPSVDRVSVERALELVEYACDTGTGVAIVPPPGA